jgi:hypothetical protein
MEYLEEKMEHKKDLPYFGLVTRYRLQEGLIYSKKFLKFLNISD